MVGGRGGGRESVMGRCGENPLATAAIAADGVLTAFPRGAHPAEGASRKRESRETLLSPALRVELTDVAVNVGRDRDVAASDPELESRYGCGGLETGATGRLKWRE
jgi:hypothetical protein